MHVDFCMMAHQEKKNAHASGRRILHDGTPVLIYSTNFIALFDYKWDMHGRLDGVSVEKTSRMVSVQ